MNFFLLLFIILNISAFAETKLINGQPAGDLFQGVGVFNLGCTITKVGEKQFITAAHCLDKNMRSMQLSFRTHMGRVTVASLHIHPSWLVDCGNDHCDGTEVGSSRMTPGRSDVAFVNVKELTPNIPVINVRYTSLSEGTEVAMVGAGCTRGIEPNGRGKMRYALTQLISYKNLEHEKSLYKNISEITGKSDWITPGYVVSKANASLCPGDSGGPLLSKNENGVWEIVGIAADYTFDGPYRDGDLTVTNLHTRLDDESLHQVGVWIRQNWAAK